MKFEILWAIIIFVGRVHGKVLLGEHKAGQIIADVSVHSCGGIFSVMPTVASNLRLHNFFVVVF